jgi:DNA repair protein RadC
MIKMNAPFRLGIKDWAEEDRPREKLMLKGAQVLSDAELIAILIGSGNNEESAVELSRRILSAAKNNLNDLGKFTIDDLVSGFKGIGEAKAITIIAALELGRRRKLAEIQKGHQIKCSEDIFNLFQPVLSDLPHEEFWLLLLNRSNTVIHKTKISQGGIVGTVVDVRIILKLALEKLATGIAVCHNHPSGNLFPSTSDVETTRKLREACQTVDIAFLDHLIVSGNKYYSFADEGTL